MVESDRENGSGKRVCRKTAIVSILWGNTCIFVLIFAQFFYISFLKIVLHKLFVTALELRVLLDSRALPVH